MIGLAAVNRFRLMPQARETRIARHAAMELAAGAGVVLIAGLLGQLQPVQ